MGVGVGVNCEALQNVLLYISYFLFFIIYARLNFVSVVQCVTVSVGYSYYCSFSFFRSDLIGARRTMLNNVFSHHTFIYLYLF